MKRIIIYIYKNLIINKKNIFIYLSVSLYVLIMIFMLRGACVNGNLAPREGYESPAPLFDMFFPLIIYLAPIVLGFEEILISSFVDASNGWNKFLFTTSMDEKDFVIMKYVSSFIETTVCILIGLFSILIYHLCFKTVEVKFINSLCFYLIPLFYVISAGEIFGSILFKNKEKFKATLALVPIIILVGITVGLLMFENINGSKFENDTEMILYLINFVKTNFNKTLFILVECGVTFIILPLLFFFSIKLLGRRDKVCGD